MNCGNCVYLASKSNPPPANFLVIGCRLHRKTFGLESDLGKTKVCKDFVKRGNARRTDKQEECDSGVLYRMQGTNRGSEA